MSKEKNNKSRSRQFSDLLVRGQKFITHDIWRMQEDKDLPRWSFLIKQLRVFILAVKGFLEDKVQLRASALTFYSMLSVVPILAMLFGIAKGFGFQAKLEEELMKNFSGQQEVLNYILEFSNRFLERTKGGLIAGVGLIILFWSVMKVLGNIEESFNNIWQVKKSRSYIRKFSDYLSIVMVAPILLIISSSLNVYITTKIIGLTQQVQLLGFFSPLIDFLLRFTPFLLIWLVFTLLYIVMPNTKVNFMSALIAGIIAGTMFQVVQWAYIHFQVGVSRYNAIYGSFAALPLFLIWLEFSWLIVLFGAEISFAIQNVENYQFESESLRISPHFKRLITLLIAHQVIKRFDEGKKPLTSEDLSHTLNVPVKIVRQITYELVESGVLTETVTDSPKEYGYQPAIDINKISVSFIIQRTDSLGFDNLDVIDNESFRKISTILDNYRELTNQPPGDLLLKTL